MPQRGCLRWRAFAALESLPSSIEPEDREALESYQFERLALSVMES